MQTTHDEGSRLRLPLARAFALLALALATLSGCDSDSDKVCEHIGNCSHGGSDLWVTSCQNVNDELSDEADAVGCQSAFEAYFSCADDQFDCQGNKSSFPGCDQKLATYSACLEAHASGTACAELERRLAECGTPPDDAGVPSPCTVSGDCSAHCYLASVPNLCAPTSAELAAFADCASHCVF